MTTLQKKVKSFFKEVINIEKKKLRDISKKAIKKIDDMTPFETEYAWRKCIDKDLNEEFARQFAEYRENMIKLKQLEGKSIN
jgi:hypothetical protein